MAKKINKNNLDITKFNFLYDAVLIKAIRNENTGIKGLDRPEQYDEKPEFGEIIKIGQGKLMDSGEVLPVDIRIGDIVFFEKYSTMQIRVNGEDYFVSKIEDIRAVQQ